MMLKETILYDGTQIKPHWGLIEHGIQGDSIISFLGPMKVNVKEMVDLQDIRREANLTEFLITADKSLHFIIEHFDQQPSNLLLAYHRLMILV